MISFGMCGNKKNDYRKKSDKNIFEIHDDLCNRGAEVGFRNALNEAYEHGIINQDNCHDLRDTRFASYLKNELVKAKWIKEDEKDKKKNKKVDYMKSFKTICNSISMVEKKLEKEKKKEKESEWKKETKGENDEK